MTQDLTQAFGRPATSLRGLLPPRREEAPAEASVPDPRPAPEPPDTRSPTVPEPRDSEGSDRAEPSAAPAPPRRVSAARTPSRRVSARASAAPAPAAPAPPAPEAPSARPARRTRPVAPTAAPAPRTTSHDDDHGRPVAATRVTADPGDRSSASAVLPAAPSSPASSANRRWGVARVASRDHVDLLVLLAVAAGPADGRDVVERLRADSGGKLDAPERTVHRTLHRLARNRLLAQRVETSSGRRRYHLTETGERVTRSRLREWRALARCVDAVARSSGSS